MLTKKIASFKSKTKEELEQEIRDFNQEISDLNIKNKEISTKIEFFKDILQYFEKQKKANKWWRLFWNFNKETNEMQIKIRDLSEELDKNAKKIASKEIQKIDIFEEITKLQDDLYQNKNDQYQAIFNKLNIIGKNQEFKTINEFSLSLAKNPFEEDDEYHDRETATNKNLREQKKEFDDEIIFFEEKSNKITNQIQILEKNVADLKKQKTVKSFNSLMNIITFGIFKYYKNKKNNKQIKILKGEIRNLSKELAENEKNIQWLKKLKLNTLEKIKTLQDSIFIKIDVNNLKEINQILTTIINKQVAEFDESNSFSSKELIERQNSEDSGITSKTKQSNNSTDSLNFSIDEDNKGYPWIDVSNCNENSHEKDKLSRSASLSLIN